MFLSFIFYFSYK